MTPSHLRPCPSCGRHVRVSEAGCPFCGESLSDEFRAAPSPRGPGARLSRAALLAFGTGSLTFAGACGSMASPAYGSSPVPFFDAGDGVPDAAMLHDAAVDDAAPPIATPAYGAPAPPIEPADASDDAHFGVAPAYGVVPGH